MLKTPIAEILTLDYRRITGKGIISGSSYKVPTLAEAHACFGSTPTNQVSAPLLESSAALPIGAYPALC